MIIRELVTRIGFQFDKTGFDRAASNIDELKSKVTQLAAAFSLPVFISGVRNLVNEAASLGSHISDTAEQFGVSIEALQRYQYTANLAGVKTEQFNAALAPLSRQIFEAGNGSKEAAEIFRKFGVALKDSSGKALSTEEVIGSIADQIAKIDDPAKQAGLAMRFFGRSGSKLVPILKQGREGLRQIGLGLDRLGGPISKEAAESLDALDDRTAEVNTAFARLKVSIAMGLVPWFTRMTEAAGTAYGALSKMIERTHIAQAAIIGLGTVLTFFALRAAVAFLPVLAPLALTAAGVSLLILAYEDLWVTLKGGDSLLSRFVKWCATAKDTADGLAGVIARLGDYLFNLTAPLERLMDMGDRSVKLDANNRINGQAYEKKVRKGIGGAPDVTYYVPAAVDPISGVPNSIDNLDPSNARNAPVINGSPMLTDHEQFMRDRSNRNSPVIDNSQVKLDAVFNITQRPGEDGEALAARMRQDFDTTVRKMVNDARAATLPRVKAAQ